MPVRLPARRFDAVIFDNDGLLLDTERAWTRAEEALFARRGVAFTIEHKRDMLGAAGALAEAKLAAMLARPAGDGPALFRELQELALDEVGHTAVPRPGAFELLERLQRAGLPLALASNSTRAFVDRALAAAGVRHGTFVTTLTTDEVALPKPAPDLYLAACVALAVPPARAVVLEDSPTGVQAALAAGCYVIGVPSVEGVQLDGASMTARSLAAPEVAAALGL